MDDGLIGFCVNHERLNHESHEGSECVGTSLIRDQVSDRIDQRAMPIGSLHIRAWRMRNRRWRLFVVRVGSWTGWSDWWPVEDWYDLMSYDTQWGRDQKIEDE